MVIEGRVNLGNHCVIRPHATLIGPLDMGEGNMVFGGAVLGAGITTWLAGWKQ